jgi:hypothetical protein
MLVTQSYIVPWSDEWPEETWDIKLGRIVTDIRCLHRHKTMKDELTALGFSYMRQSTGFGWEVVKSALDRYKELEGNIRDKRSFVIPSDTPDWPANLWGIKLGSVVHNIRNCGHYHSHRDELEAMGFDYTAQRR